MSTRVGNPFSEREITQQIPAEQNTKRTEFTRDREGSPLTGQKPLPGLAKSPKSDEINAAVQKSVSKVLMPSTDQDLTHINRTPRETSWENPFTERPVARVHEPISDKHDLSIFDF